MTPQPLHALTAANAIRARRYQLRKDLKALGAHQAPAVLAEHLDDPPAWLSTVPVAELLSWLPRWGDLRAESALRALGVPGGACVAGSRSSRCPSVLSERQRALVAGMLRGEQHREAA